MADLNAFETNPQDQLFKEIDDARCVMLGSTDPSDHMQPMAPQINTDLGHHIWFYSDNTSELGKAVMANSGRVMLCHIGKDYQACVQGTLQVEPDSSKIDHFWNPIADSWYPGGKSDPKMLMLRYTPDTAGVWASDKTFIGFAYETLKANLTDTTPDVGKHKEIVI